MTATTPSKPQDPNIPSPDSTNHLFRLPVELRLEIYEFTLSDFHFSSKDPTGTTTTPPLLLTCHRIRKEATNTYLHSLTTFSRRYSAWAAQKLRKYTDRLRRRCCRTGSWGLPVVPDRLDRYLQSIENVVEKIQIVHQKSEKIRRRVKAEQARFEEEKVEGIVVEIEGGVKLDRV